MNVGVDSARRYNQALTRKCLSGSSHSHSRTYAVHRVRVSGLSDSSDFSVFDSDISLVNSCIIKNYTVRNHQVQITAIARCVHRLPHSVAKSLSATEFCFVAVNRKVFFNLNQKICISKSDFVAGSRAVHGRVFFSVNRVTHFASPLNCLSVCQIVQSVNLRFSAKRAKLNPFCLAWLKPNAHP